MGKELGNEERRGRNRKKKTEPKRRERHAPYASCWVPRVPGQTETCRKKNRQPSMVIQKCAKDRGRRRHTCNDRDWTGFKWPPRNTK